MADYFSHSQMETFASCGLKYNYRYVQRLKRPSDSSALIFGTAVHKAIEMYHKSLFGERMTERAMMEIFGEEWRKLLAESEVEIKFKKGESKDILFDVGIDICHQYHRDHIDCPPPALFVDDAGELVPAVEISFNLEMTNDDYKMTKPISGKIDLVTPLPLKKGVFVIDHKTSGRAYEDFKVNTSTQLALYAWAFRELLAQGRFPDLKVKKETATGFNVFTKKGETKTRSDSKGEVQYILKTIFQEDIDHMKTIYSMMDRAIKAEVYLPNYGMGCSWCDYKADCETFKYRKGQEDANPA